MPSGTATLDFGAFPGSSHATVAVTGQAAIVAGSLVGAWMRPVATADHTADEHLVEPISVIAGDIVAATGFTIHGVNANPMPEPMPPPPSQQSSYHTRLNDVFYKLAASGTISSTSPKGEYPKVYGQWTVTWAWS